MQSGLSVYEDFPAQREQFRMTTIFIFVPMSNQLINFLNQYCPIPSTDEPLIEAATEYRIYKKGDYLFKAGKVCREMFLVCKGILRIVADTEAGTEVTHFFIRENKLCSILN